jgi:homopolymeric O-antigen transport system permease protein
MHSAGQSGAWSLSIDMPCPAKRRKSQAYRAPFRWLPSVRVPDPSSDLCDCKFWILDRCGSAMQYVADDIASEFPEQIALMPVSPSDQMDEWPPPSSRSARAWRDLVDGFRMNWMWTALALQDIKLRYRGSMLGPFWITITTIVMVVAMGTIFARLFHQSHASYLPYLMSGLVVWQFVPASINDGCSTFLIVSSVIQQVPMPFSIHAYRTVFRNLLVLAHSIVIIPVGILYFHVPIGWNILEVLPALVLLSINAVWVSILLGMISTRFRDVPPIISNFIQVLFFVTPVFWSPDALGRWKTLAELNPLFAAVDIMRAPMIGHDAATYSWTIMILMTIVGSVLTFLFYARFRTRIAYWL